MYLPKCRYKLIQSTEGLFLNSDRTLYNGPIIESYSGEYFKGSDPSNVTERVFSGAPDKQEEPLTNYYPQPTEQDYERGFFTRYFLQVRSSKKVLEVRKNQFNTVDTGSYNREAITWVLTGSRLTQFPVAQRSNAAVLVNAETLRSLEERFPGVSEFVFDDQFVR